MNLQIASQKRSAASYTARKDTSPAVQPTFVSTYDGNYRTLHAFIGGSQNTDFVLLNT